jgi:hypothetical protein
MRLASGRRGSTSSTAIDCRQFGVVVDNRGCLKGGRSASAAFAPNGIGRRISLGGMSDIALVGSSRAMVNADWSEGILHCNAAGTAAELMVAEPVFSLSEARVSS